MTVYYKSFFCSMTVFYKSVYSTMTVYYKSVYSTMTVYYKSVYSTLNVFLTEGSMVWSDWNASERYWEVQKMLRQSLCLIFYVEKNIKCYYLLVNASYWASREGGSNQTAESPGCYGDWMTDSLGQGVRCREHHNERSALLECTTKPCLLRHTHTHTHTFNLLTLLLRPDWDLRKSRTH